MNSIGYNCCKIKIFGLFFWTDTVFQTLTFPNTTVPAMETNYYCMTFDLRTDGDYHLIATKPVIKNSNVVHHMLLYGCDDNGNIHTFTVQNVDMVVHVRMSRLLIISMGTFIHKKNWFQKKKVKLCKFMM